MTKYHPVTEEELDQIKNDCKYPELIDCEECGLFDGQSDLPCSFKGANILMDEVMERPDPLDILMGFLSVYNVRDEKSELVLMLFIKELKTNPMLVIERGKKEGWWKE